MVEADYKAHQDEKYQTIEVTKVATTANGTGVAKPIEKQTK